ncbi:MAG TPA: ATP-binding protein [Pseudonocardia sp.]|jgi:anti-sigma regulatory factor (Ser/Thr protein kinase)|nr:ATP-binding protein [Pseudonocardia sp.]
MDPVAASRSAEDMSWVRLDDASAIGTARRTTESLAAALGLRPGRVAEVGLAVTEMATNVHRHGGGGSLLLRAIRHAETAALEVVALDAGPGMLDVARSRRDGHSTGGTLGIGLGAIDRLADAVEISSMRDRGTVVVARFEGDRRRPSVQETAAGITRAIAGETVCGDAYAVRREGDRTLLMVADGSGHGPLAAAASREAVRVFLDGAGVTSPEPALRTVHRALSGTRGAAVAVAELDPAAGVVRFAGIGNIAGAVVTGGAKQSMVSIGGVAGFRQPTIRTFTYPLEAGSLVVLQSDGVTPRWNAADIGPVLGRSALLVAATVLRDSAVRPDDACVAVARAAG